MISDVILADLADVMFCCEERLSSWKTHHLGIHIDKPFIFFKESSKLIEDKKDCILLLINKIKRYWDSFG